MEVSPAQTVPVVFLDEQQPGIAGGWIGDQLRVTLATGEEVTAESSDVSDAALWTMSEVYAEQADARLEACWGAPIDQERSSGLSELDREVPHPRPRPAGIIIWSKESRHRNRSG